MACNCNEQRRIEWVRVNVENKAICSQCGRDVPIDEIEAKETTGYLDSLDFRGVKASGNGKTP